MADRRELDYKTFDELAADVRMLRDAGSDPVGGWTLGQCCAHIRGLFECSMDGFDFKLAFPLRLVGRLMLKRTIRTRHVPTGAKAPESMLPGESTALDDRAEADALLTMIERYRQHTGELHASPFFGAMSREQWDAIHLIHAAHHFSFQRPRTAATATPS